MSGLTPKTPGSELSGLQDVLAFIADFEMEENAPETKLEETERSEQCGQVCNAGFEALLVGDSRMSTTSSSGGATTASLSTSNALDQPFATAIADPIKTTRRHRVSRKEELEYLRKKVKDMEDNLLQLKNSSVQGQSVPAVDALKPFEAERDAVKLQQSVALWKTMAERQKSQRELVENENAKLREKLKTQVRMAKSLQRILHKRERAAEQIANESPKRMKQLSQDVAMTTDGFDELIQGLNSLYLSTNERISSYPAASPSLPIIREQDVKYDDISGMFLEFRHSKLLPFDIGTATRANWRHLSETGIKFNTYFEESTETRDDTVLRKFGVEFKLDNHVAKMSGRQAIQRYIEGQRVVIVRNSTIDRIEFSGAAAGGVTFREAGWVVLQDVTGQYSDSGPMTLVKSCSTMTPDIDLDSHWEVGALTDFVLQSRTDIEIGNESVVESLLLEEASKRPK
ncbi:hypothetical protein PHYBOEH_007526 [Phytophthora boehmeriae]|uniref:M96 mating-specific protein family n=1 Tax=Phytophthora boehmeriae TaxID=109152 RepID=A0A8T1W7L1_9STRA|nr:hypothetical protein PHYBOEH_007526 [Phytophthora boehmeriae]